MKLNLACSASKFLNNFILLSLYCLRSANYSYTIIAFCKFVNTFLCIL
nr:MAG TPA: hypothetical protein [Caudoviricetes sp.]